MSFASDLIRWYEAAHRDLPWRKTKDPYRIWLSEIILQQTRVQQGLPYYERFVTHYPTVFALASASEQQVLRDWQGLGYYSRARNLQSAAKQIVSDFKGQFPADYNKLRTLKGVGDYTASAIASMAFDLPHAVVDGNVYRVLSRVYGIQEAIDQLTGQRLFKAKAQELIDPARPGSFNQAIMELGATCCTPRNPECGRCPLANGCIARQQQRITELPVKAGKIKVRDRYFNYVLIAYEDGLYLNRRGEGDIWQGLYDPWLIEADSLLDTKELLARFTQNFSITNAELLGAERTHDYKHLLSYQRLHARFWLVRIFSKLQQNDLNFVSRSDLNHYPLPKLISTYINSIEAWLD